MEELRLQKYMADCGIAARRKCEEYILSGQVKVNGTIASLGVKVNPKSDVVEFRKKQVQYPEENKKYILLNKPIGYVTTVKDQFSRQTVLDLVKEINTRLVPVGRLDMYTSGALILTNDGEFVYKVTHPKYEIKKTYIATLIGIVQNEKIEELRNGVDIGGYITKPAKVKIIKIDKEKNISRIEIIIHEGKNREVRKMCEKIGYKVKALHRSKIGNLDVKNLKIGNWRYLSLDEVKSILKS